MVVALAALALLTAETRLTYGADPASAPGGTPDTTLEATPTNVRRAREHFRKGDQHFKAGRFDEAYQEWDAGYQLSGRPLFLVNMAHAERRRGELRKARSLYQRYLQVEPDSKVGADIEAVLAEIDQTLAAQERSVKQGPSVAADPGPPARPERQPNTTTATAMATPGRWPAVLPVATGGPSAVSKRDRTSAMLAQRAPAAEESQSRPLYRRWWVWAGVGGAVALGVATTMLIQARSGPAQAREGSIGTLGTAE